MDEIILKVLKGEVDLYETIVNQYQLQLYKYIKYLINSSDDVEDILQEVFIRGYKNLSRYKIGTSFNAWLYRLTYNHTMNYMKKRNRSKVVYLETLPEIIAIEVPDNQMSETTRAALGQLSIEERNLLFLRIYEELSYKEIAQLLHKRDSSLRKQYERARKKFKANYVKEMMAYERQTNECIN
ncbi:MAG: RNA polymerase sigma factor [Clostridiales bacterium]|nr:RNA polymerase sigma factor [Clostridiales bacterium]